MRVTTLTFSEALHHRVKLLLGRSVKEARIITKDAEISRRVQTEV
jgi:hypothetical protein